jgi:hypothetical protein
MRREKWNGDKQSNKSPLDEVSLEFIQIKRAFSYNQAIEAEPPGSTLGGGFSWLQSR